MTQGFFENFILLRFPLLLISATNSGIQLIISKGANRCFYIFWHQLFREDPFFLASLSHHIFLEGYDFLDFFMGCHDAFQDVLFRNFLGAPFNHEDSIFCTCNDDVKVSVCQLFLGWINHELTINPTHANTCNRTIPRNIG